MGIMDNEGHDPMGFGNVRSALPMQADPDPHGALKEARAEIARLREQLSHEWPAIEELAKEREMYRMRWLGSLTPEDAALIRAENERLKAAIRPFALAARGETFFPNADEWQRASAVYTNTGPSTGEQSQESKS